VTLAPDALSVLSKIGIETTMQYAMQLLITSHLIAAKWKSMTVEMNDIQRAYTLFLDQARSVKYLETNAEEFVLDNEWEADMALN
jgi:RuvB-like protein 2